MKATQMIGQKFGRFTVVSLAEKDSGGRARALCRCECGTEKVVDCYSLKSGNSRSCGCLNSEVVTARNTTHGGRDLREYHVWYCMTQRCNNPKNKAFRYYGGKGIKVCEAWSAPHGFPAFIKDMGLAPSADHSIDRKDGNGNYEPGNCRWATKEEQARNKSSNRMLTWKGETRCVSEWADITGISRMAISLRIDRRGWSVEKALTTPFLVNQYSER